MWPGIVRPGVSVECSGEVSAGQGRGASFTRLPWAREQFLARLGIDPFPGTLNLRLGTAGASAAWVQRAAGPGLPVLPADGRACAARCYPVRARSRDGGPVTAAVVMPEVKDYPAGQLEVIASVSLREVLGVGDGDRVVLESVQPGSWQGVIFDVDGTLVDSLPGYRLAAQRVAESYGWTISDEAVHRTLNFGESFWSLVVPTGERGNQPLLDRLRLETWRHWPAVLQDSVGLLPGISGALATLRARGLRLGICTASRGESFLPLERAGLLGFFDVVVTGRDVSRRKPDPEGLLLCLERMGLGAAEAVYVGDTLADVQASRAAGLHAVGVLTGAADSALLSRAGAHRILPDLHGLAELLSPP